MTRREALIGLNLIGGIGSTRLKMLVDYFGSPEAVLALPQEKLASIPGIGGITAQRIHSLKNEDIEQELDCARRAKVSILTPDDEGYPLNLKYIPDPPIALYVKGRVNREDSIALAVVGSRIASAYGLCVAERFAQELSCRGLTIVSGLARGIDTSAHRGALRQKRRTIAVMGSGFNYIYPQENRRMADQIAECGAVVSEFPMDTSPLRQNFPRRNRIISGLSLGVLVVEAARNSGALITADCALEQGRDVFALPGNVDSRTSFGTHELIKQGAKLVSCIEDIIEELGLPSQEATPGRANASTPVKLSSQEDVLYRILSSQPLPMDALVEKTNWGVPVVSALLLSLEMKKMVEQLPGKHFMRSA